MSEQNGRYYHEIQTGQGDNETPLPLRIISRRFSGRTGPYSPMEARLLGVLAETKARDVACEYNQSMAVQRAAWNLSMGRQRVGFSYGKGNYFGPMVSQVRLAGPHVYGIVMPEYLQPVKTKDWSKEVFRAHCHGLYPRPVQGRLNLMPYSVGTVDIPEDILPGETVTITYTTTVEHHPLRPSERRARVSSTMDGNGKPRKRKR